MRTFKKFIGISLAVLCFTLTSYSQDKPKATYRVGKSIVTVWETEREGEYDKLPELSKNYTQHGPEMLVTERSK